MTARPSGPRRLYLTFAAADRQIATFPRRRTSSAFHRSQSRRLRSDRGFAAIDHFRFLIDLVKAPCLAAFPSPKAGEFIGFNVFLDAIINCAQDPISATPPPLSPKGDSWRR